MRTRLGFLLAISLFITAAGCGDPVEIRNRVFDFLNTTQRLTREFVYSEEVEGNSVTVKGRLEDAFRYYEILSKEDQDLVEWVVSDDTLAIRMIDPGKVPFLQDGSLLPGASLIVTDALRQGRWVLDPAGAPSVIRTDEDRTADPLLAAVEVLDYVRVAVTEAFNVKQWREQDLDPAYRPHEDIFPQPKIEQGEQRYDLQRPILPRPTGALNTQQNQPRTSHFRKMAIYVKGGRITRVMEHVDIEGHFEFVRARERNSTRMLELLEAIQTGAGPERIVERKMEVSFSELGSDDIAIDVPRGALVASLRSAFAGTPSIGSFFSVAPMDVPAIPTGEPAEGQDAAEGEGASGE